MIESIQKKRIAEALLKIFYRKGYVPDYREFVDLLNKKFRFKEFGRPFFTPRGAARGLVVDPNALKDNVTEIRDDLDITFTDMKDMLGEYTVSSNGLYGEFLQFRQRLQTISEDLDALLLRESVGGSEVLFDNFRNTDKIDLQNTTAYVDSDGGYATLPISTATSVRYSSDRMQIASERFSSGYNPINGQFIDVFNDYIDRVWQAQLPANGFYQVDVNITGGEVVQGHTNEIEINRIVVDPILPVTITIEGSTDSLNWFSIANATISSVKVFELDPTWVLFLRFTIAGNVNVSIRNIQISKVGTADSGLLFSKALSTSAPIYDFQFSADQEIPYGTSISHYVFTGQDVR